MTRTLKKSSDATDQHVQDLSDSLIMKSNWSLLLSAAPLALAFVGSCQTAASSPTAAGLQLRKKDGSPSNLKWDTLSANLIFLADTGRSTFMKAEDRMRKLGAFANRLSASDGVVNTIINTLASHDKKACAYVSDQMEELKDTVDDCMRCAKEITEAFDNWLEVAKELSQAVAESKDLSSKERSENAHDLILQQNRKEVAEQEKARREAAVREAEQSMKFAEDQFQRASRNVPSGWNSIAMSLVESLGNTVTSILSKLMNVFTPNGSKERSNERSTESYELVFTQLDLLHLMLRQAFPALINSIKNDHCQEMLASNEAWVGNQLEMIQSVLENTAIYEQNKYGLLSVVDEARTLHRSLQSAVEKRVPSGGHTEHWWETLDKLQHRVNEIKAELDCDEKPSKPRPIYMSKKQAYERAKHQLETERRSYDHSNLDLQETINRIKKVQSEVESLSQGVLKLSSITEILDSSIANLIHFKLRIADLLEFIQNTTSLVEITVGSSCRPFVRIMDTTVRNSAVGDTVHGSSDMSLPNSTNMQLPDLQKEFLLRYTVEIRSRFMVVGEVTKLYTHISREHIIPGINVLDRMGLPYDKDQPESHVLRSRNEELETYQNNAIEYVKDYCKEKREYLLSRMATRVEEIRESTKQLPADEQVLPMIEEDMVKNSRHTYEKATCSDSSDE